MRGLCEVGKGVCQAGVIVVIGGGDHVFCAEVCACVEEGQQGGDVGFGGEADEFDVVDGEACGGEGGFGGAQEGGVGHQRIAGGFGGNAQEAQANRVEASFGGGFDQARWGEMERCKMSEGEAAHEMGSVMGTKRVGGVGWMGCLGEGRLCGAGAMWGGDEGWEAGGRARRVGMFGVGWMGVFLGGEAVGCGGVRCGGGGEGWEAEGRVVGREGWGCWVRVGWGVFGR